MMAFVAADTNFITVTASTLWHENPSPGNYDPIIAVALSDYTAKEAQKAEYPESRSLLEERASRWYRRSLQMGPRQRNRRVNWWGDPYEANGRKDNSTESAINGTVISLPSGSVVPNLTDLDTE